MAKHLVLGSVKEITASVGTGPVTLGGAVPRFRTLAAAMAAAPAPGVNGDTFDYVLLSGDTAVERGVGTISNNGVTVTRTRIKWSTNANNPIVLSGVSTLFCDRPAPDASEVWHVPANITQWGKTAYPAGYTFLNGPNTYLVGDAGDTSSDVSLLMRTAGNARWEAGMVGANTDGVVNQSYRIKSITGDYLSEIFTDRFVISDLVNPRYPFIDIYPAPSESSRFRIYGSGSEAPMLVIGNSNGEISPTGAGAGLELSYECGSDIARFTAITHDAYYRDMVFEGNSIRFSTGAVFLNTDMVRFNSQGAVLVGNPIQKAVSAVVSNAGAAGLALMSGYVPGTSVLTALGGTGTAPTFNVTVTQLSRVNSIAAAGTGGTNSTATTLTAAAAAGATAITVASIAGFAAGDQIDIALAAGGYHHTTVNGAPSGSTITLTAGLPSAANNGANVYEGRIVTGVGGTGTKFQASVRIAAGGIAEMLAITVRGDYTVNPPILGEQVTGAGLTGATLNISLGAKTLTLATAGALTVTPNTPVATSATGGGTGATLDITYQAGLGDINVASEIFDNGTPPTGTAGSGYVRATGATLNVASLSSSDSITAGTGSTRALSLIGGTGGTGNRPKLAAASGSAGLLLTPNDDGGGAIVRLVSESSSVVELSATDATGNLSFQRLKINAATLQFLSSGANRLDYGITTAGIWTFGGIVRLPGGGSGTGLNSAGGILQFQNTDTTPGNWSRIQFLDSGGDGMITLGQKNVDHVNNIAAFAIGVRLAGEANPTVKIDFNDANAGAWTVYANLIQRPTASVTPAANGDLAVQATSNTQLTFKYKGSDGVVRAANLTLA